MKNMVEFDEKQFMRAAVEDSPFDVYHLYKAVEENADYLTCKCIERKVSNGFQYFVYVPWLSEPLLLNSVEEKKKFLDLIEQTYFNGMDVEGYYSFHRNMEE